MSAIAGHAISVGRIVDVIDEITALIGSCRALYSVIDYIWFPTCRRC